MSDEASDAEMLQGLNALFVESFPKKCACCGTVYPTLEDFVSKTVPIEREGVSSFKEAEEDDDTKLVEVFRNCPCGSTLMEFCKDRRDTSPEGERRRRAFDIMLDRLTGRGMALEAARTELRKFMRGQTSPELKSYLKAG